MVTYDEAWIYITDSNKKRSIMYRPRDKKDLVQWYTECAESSPKGFMIATGISHKGKLKIRRIEKNAKINSEYYQRNILIPIFKEDIPHLFGTDTPNVIFYHDKASSHVSWSTVNFLETLRAKTGINTVEPKRIPVKSPDCSPMYFCTFGLLKRQIGNEHLKTIEMGLWKVVREEWEKLELATLRRCLLSWKVRCRAVAKNHGYPVEHLKYFRYGLKKK